MLERIIVCGVPMDICKVENLENEILEILAKPGAKQIVFLSVWKFLKARRKKDYLECLKDADLVLPISKSILKGAKVLGKKMPVRYNPFEAVISILSILEVHYKTLFLLGSTKESLMRTESNLRDTFPNLHIVGRCVGYFKKDSEQAIIQAIFKSQPSLVLVSDGIKEGDFWSYKRRSNFGASVFLYYHDAFGIFSKRIARVSRKTFEKGHEIFMEVLRNPLKVFLIFPYIWYLLTIFFYKKFRSK